MPRTRARDNNWLDGAQISYVCKSELDEMLLSDHLTKRLFEAEKKQGLTHECPICLQPVLAECCAAYTTCHGPFHLRCLARCNSCPICRKE